MYLEVLAKECSNVDFTPGFPVLSYDHRTADIKGSNPILARITVLERASNTGTRGRS